MADDSKVPFLKRKGTVRMIKFSAVIIAIIVAILIFQALLLDFITSTPFLNSIYEYVLSQLRDTSMIWLFVVAFLGGFFIIPIASDFLFLYYVLVGANPILALIATFTGVMISRSMNFGFGKFFSGYAHEHFIKDNAEDFQKKLEKWGDSILFYGNFFPFFPNELFIVFIGTTNYKFNKFLFYHGLSKLLKLAGIIIIIKLMLYFGWISSSAFMI